MTSITWAGPRYVQELGTFLGSQNRTQRRCVALLMYVLDFTIYGASVIRMILLTVSLIPILPGLKNAWLWESEVSSAKFDRFYGKYYTATK